MKRVRAISLTIRGKSPLIMHRFAGELIYPDEKNTTGKVKRPEMTREEEAELGLYKDEHGRVMVPSYVLMGMLKAAGREMFDGKRKWTTDSRTLVTARVFLIGETCSGGYLLESSTSWHAQSFPVTNPSTKGKILSHRPVFNEWELSLAFEYRDTEEERVREMWDIAGVACGLANWRPNKGGVYGRFDVVKWDRVEDDESGDVAAVA